VGGAIVVLALCVFLTVVGYALATPLQDWVHEAPGRFEMAQEKLRTLRKPVEQVSDVAKRLQHVADGPTTQPEQPAIQQGPSALSRFLGAVSLFVSELVEVILMLYLLLASGDLFFKKLLKVVRFPDEKRAAAEVVNDVQSAVLRYLLVNAMVNAGQAIVVALVLWWLKMPNPVLWGVFTFVLEFVPYLGAAAMIIMLSVVAFAEFSNLGHILLVPGSYLAITTLQNNIVSPIAYGNHLKLNPVAVLIGVLFWWFMWGIPGAFLAVPIIATIKIISDRTERFRAVGEFLGE
jgi:predicted PurR-regulated permease PerM